ERRGARRRRRVLRLGQAGSVRALTRRGLAAARARPRGQAQTRRRGGPMLVLERRRLRRKRSGREGSPRDGGGVPRSECSGQRDGRLTGPHGLIAAATQRPFLTPVTA